METNNLDTYSSDRASFSYPKPGHIGGKCRLLIAVLTVAFSLVTGGAALQAQTQPSLIPVYFTGVVGGDEDWGRRVLLRWDTLDGVVDLTNAVIFRTDGANNREKVSVVSRTRSATLIKSIFYRPGEERALNAAEEYFVRIHGSPSATQDEFAQRVIAALDGEDNADAKGAQHTFMIQSNYGFALVEGLGYLDFVDPASGPYVYELWQGDNAGNPVDALGQITVDVQNVVQLPAPVNLQEVFLRGRDGVTPARAANRRVYLNWEVAESAIEFSTISFGFNIYKLARGLEAGEDFDTVKNELVRLNRVPILEPSPIEDEDPDQTYIYADDGDWLETLDEDDLLTVGDTCTYWAVARDLLGNEGLPSNPVVAVVRDTVEPDMVKGVFVVAAQDTDHVPYLSVMWDNLGPDAVAYKVYRYQNYGNAAKKGPFSDVNGLTEGLIATVPAPAVPDAPKVNHADYEPNSAALGTGFWYSVSALDEHGNESALSPAVYGVLDDVVGPAPGRITEFCISRPVIRAFGNVVDQADTRESEWAPLLTARRDHPSIAKGRFYERTQNGQLVFERILYEFDFLANDQVTYYAEPLESVVDQDDVPSYRFVAETLDGATATVTVDPPSFWEDGSPRQVYRFEATVASYDLVCDPLGPNETGPGLVPVIPGGDMAPFQITMGCDGDAVGYRLYRSVDGCKTYELVEEVPCDGVSLALKDNFHPESATEACYSIVPLDKHGNLGSPQYFQPIVVYMGTIPSATLISATATGLGTPSVTLNWIGPKAGIQYYAVHFVVDGQKQARPKEYRIADLNYDETLNEFSLSVDEVNRDGDPLDKNTNYEVFVEAVSISGASKESDRVPFTWASKAFNDGATDPGDFRWNARPLPPVIDYTPSRIIVSGALRGVALQILEGGGTEAGIDYYTTPAMPFMVWRQRVDKPNQPWIAVSPLIESINRNGMVLDDAFFEYIENPSTMDFDLFFIDRDSGHVQDATYRYLFMQFDDETGEIEYVREPFQISIIIPG